MSKDLHEVSERKVGAEEDTDGVELKNEHGGKKCSRSKFGAVRQMPELREGEKKGRGAPGEPFWHLALGAQKTLANFAKRPMGLEERPGKREERPPASPQRDRWRKKTG